MAVICLRFDSNCSTICFFISNGRLRNTSRSISSSFYHPRNENKEEWSVVGFLHQSEASYGTRLHAFHDLPSWWGGEEGRNENLVIELVQAMVVRSIEE